MEEQVQISHSAPLMHDIKSQTSSFGKVAVVPRINGPAEQWIPYEISIVSFLHPLIQKRLKK